MYISKITQNHFRNLKTSDVKFDSGVTVIVGDNGQGKTNLLEAVYVLVKGFSFRTSKTAYLLNNKSSQCVIDGLIEIGNLKYNCQLNIEHSRRTIFLNGKKTAASQLPAVFPVVLFSPESLAAIKEGPDVRRRLVDELLIIHDRRNALLLADYQRCLKSRNRVFKDYCNEKIQKSEAWDVINSLNGVYLPLAVKLTLARIQALRDMGADFKTSANHILNSKNVDISVEYLVSDQSALDWSEKDIYYATLNRLEELRNKEFETEITLGVQHSNDIHFFFKKEYSRYYCSKGQQKTLILAFKMAQIMYHYRVHQNYPLLLLDDVLSELDPERRSCLITFLKGLTAQIILTTTDLHFPMNFEKDRLTIYKISQGEVSCNGE